MSDMIEVTAYIEPMGKPRMTQRDKWAKRPCVERYFKFKDDLKHSVGSIIPDDVYDVSWTAYFSMPKSWSRKKKDEMRGARHMQTPDRDNLDKAILDSLFKDDSRISDGHIRKRWNDGNGPRIELTFNNDIYGEM